MSFLSRHSQSQSEHQLEPNLASGDLNPVAVNNLNSDDYGTIFNADAPGPISSDYGDSDDEDDRDLYEVEKITSMRLHGRSVEFYVKWKGYPVEVGEWKRLNELRGCRSAVKSYITNEEYFNCHLPLNRQASCVKQARRWLKTDCRSGSRSWRRLNPFEAERIALISAVTALDNDEARAENILRGHYLSSSYRKRHGTNRFVHALHWIKELKAAKGAISEASDI